MRLNVTLLGIRPHVLYHIPSYCSDGFELEFSSSSQAEPSQAGALWFSSWNRQYVYQISRFCSYHTIPPNLLLKINSTNHRGPAGLPKSNPKHLDDLVYHVPACCQEVAKKLAIVNGKIREKLADARQLVHCIELGCDLCHPHQGVAYE